MDPALLTANDFVNRSNHWSSASSSSRNGMLTPYGPYTHVEQELPSELLTLSLHSQSMYSGHSLTSPAISPSPALSGTDQSRSSISSTVSDPSLLPEQYYVAQRPLLKYEAQEVWLPSASLLDARTQSPGFSPHIASDRPYLQASSPGMIFAADFAMAWPKQEACLEVADLDVVSSSSSHLQSKKRAIENRRTNGVVVRTKALRKMTTREDANFQCDVRGCGKLFSRSYNYKAHLETHSDTREYPFPCNVSGCTKKFVRKTDLQRHYISVHEKSKDFECAFCSRLFARKDTLRRYEINVNCQFQALTSIDTWKMAVLKDST